LLNRIRYRILLVVGIAALLGLVATGVFYAVYQEQMVKRQNEHSMGRLTDAISEGLKSVMLAGTADIAQAYADRLKAVPQVTEFRIMRINGLEAFRDNKTTDEVNDRRGDDGFPTREVEEQVQVMDANDPNFKRALSGKDPVAFYDTDRSGSGQLVFLAPIMNESACYKCHGRANPVRGMMRLTTSMAEVERDILQIRQRSLIVIGIGLLGVVLLTGYALGRTVVRPIERVTEAMGRVSQGDLDHKIVHASRDELGDMARSFNLMTSELKETYKGLNRERDKLKTIIGSATEGIVVTDAGGAIVLVNDAATEFLGKSDDEIRASGFLGLFGDPVLVAKCIETAVPQDIEFNGRLLQTHVSEIRANDGHVIGSTALMRDITQTKELEAELRRRSTTDALTGLFNRRFLDQALEVEFARAQRTHGQLSVIMFDIDHFKKFNDTHGHDQGDRVLQMVSACLRSTVRSFDFPCRYGGEEYVGILPGLPAAEAAEMAEALRLKVAETEIDGLHVFISIGVATFPDLAIEKAEGLIETADSALYRAKENGRNRVVVAEISDLVKTAGVEA
jgi:diguanylate cyclase (GGDEF)-like protein/PAS domain S-box-containing protein